MNPAQSAWRITTLVVTIIALLAIASPVVAQDSPVGFNIGVGPIFPNGDVADHFDTGYTIPVGVTWNITNTFGLQFEYNYARMNGPSTSLQSTDNLGRPSVIIVDSNHQMNNGTFNLVFKTPTSGAVGAYGLVGPGFYHRSVELTTPDVGFTVICNPWWYYCDALPVGIDRVVGSRSTTNFGVNFGGGVTFGKFYVEVRYHYVQGPEFKVPAQAGATGVGTVKANGHYLPINFGFRF